MYSEMFQVIREEFPNCDDIIVEIKTNQAGIDMFTERIKEHVKNQGMFVMPNDLTPAEEFKFTTLSTPYGTIKLTKDA